MAGIWSVSLRRDKFFSVCRWWQPRDSLVGWHLYLFGIKRRCVGCDDALLASQMLVSELCWAFWFIFARAGDFDVFNIVIDVGVKGGACGDIAGDKCDDLSWFEVDNNIGGLTTMISLAKDGPARTAKGQWYLSGHAHKIFGLPPSFFLGSVGAAVGCDDAFDCSSVCFVGHRFLCREVGDVLRRQQKLLCLELSTVPYLGIIKREVSRSRPRRQCQRLDFDKLLPEMLTSSDAKRSSFSSLYHAKLCHYDLDWRKLSR